jgi:hemolysin III
VLEFDTANPYSRTEEIAHSLTAALGVAALLLAIPWLLVRATESTGAWRVIGVTAFGCGGLLMFATSTLYHAVRRPTAKAMLRRLDHSAIYVLIAGTYTPFTLGVVRGSLGWFLFGILWTLAIVGVIVKLTGAMLRIPWASTLIYLLMGWIGLVACRQLWNNLTAMQFGWLIAGGLCYTAGVPFYLWKSRPYSHVVWHLFVLGGVACHSVAIFSLICGPSA